MRARQRHLNTRFFGAVVDIDTRFITGQANNSQIASLPNRVGSNNFTGDAGTRPTYVENVLNGNPSIRFNSAWLYCSSLMTGTTSRMLIVLYKHNGTGTYSYVIAGQSISSVTGSWFAMQARTQFATGDPYIAGFNADTQNNKSTPDSLPKIGCGAYDGTNLMTYKNGTQIDSVARSLNTQTGNFHIGVNNTAQERLNGDVFYISLILQNSLSVQKRIERSASLSFKIACS